MIKRILAIVSLLALTVGVRAATEPFAIDPVHSTVSFSIRHLVSKFTGNFTKVTGTINVDQANLENSTVDAVIDVGSIDTRDAKRNGHLLSADFFDVAKFPSMTFKSKSWKKTGEGTYDVAGDLTIRGVTKPVVLKVTSLGFAPGMKPGTTTSGWEVAATLNRGDFGVNGPAMLGKMLGDEVTVSIGAEANH